MEYKPFFIVDRGAKRALESLLLCVEFVMNFDKIRYAKFSIKEALHRKYAAIRHRKFNCWALGDYEALRQLDIKKLRELQGKMRRMYA